MEYAEIDAENVALQDVDFSQGFGRRTAQTKIRLRTNEDVLLRFESRGFKNSKGEDMKQLNKWVGYHYQLQGYTYQTQSFEAGGWRGGWNRGDSLFRYTGETIEIPFEVRFSASESEWDRVRAGQYQDIVTITVSRFDSL